MQFTVWALSYSTRWRIDRVCPAFDQLTLSPTYSLPVPMQQQRLG
jgi:hypothetical protein